MESRKDRMVSASVAFILLSTVVLALVRVCGLAKIDWFWVLCPVWLPFTAAICVLLGTVLVEMVRRRM